MFRKKYPIAWSYHRNTSRWPHNVLRLNENLQETPAFKELADSPAVSLPPPIDLQLSLGESIRNRFSCRRFADKLIALETVATLLFWAYGKLGICYPNGTEMVTRPVPSGGGLYPLELYIIALRIADLKPGIYHYQALCHLLECVSDGAIPPNLLSELFMRQPYVAQSGLVLVLTSVFNRSMWKYEDRGYRYLLFEAGHVVQNVNLGSVALGLSSLNLGGFFDVDLINFMQLNGEEEAPLYAVAIGHPEEGPAEVLRIPIENS